MGDENRMVISIKKDDLELVEKELEDISDFLNSPEPISNKQFLDETFKAFLKNIKYLKIIHQIFIISINCIKNVLGRGSKWARASLLVMQ